MKPAPSMPSESFFSENETKRKWIQLENNDKYFFLCWCLHEIAIYFSNWRDSNRIQLNLFKKFRVRFDLEQFDAKVNVPRSRVFRGFPRIFRKISGFHRKIFKIFRGFSKILGFFSFFPHVGFPRTFRSFPRCLKYFSGFFRESFPRFSQNFSKIFQNFSRIFPRFSGVFQDYFEIF